MKLVYSDWKAQIEFSEKESIWVINLEDPAYFSKIIAEFIEQCGGSNGKFVLSSEDRLLDFSKISEIVLSPFQLDFKSRKIQTGILKQMVEIANGDEYLNTQEICTAILQYAYRVSDHLEYDIAFDENIDATQIFKMVNFKADHGQTDVLEKLTDYICIVRRVLDLQLIVIVGLHNYLSKQELELFYKTAMLNKVSLLLLENGHEDEKISCEKWLTIDRDLCEI